MVSYDKSKYWKKMIHRMYVKDYSVIKNKMETKIEKQYLVTTKLMKIALPDCYAK